MGHVLEGYSCLYLFVLIYEIMCANDVEMKSFLTHNLLTSSHSKMHSYNVGGGFKFRHCHHYYDYLSLMDPKLMIQTIHLLYYAHNISKNKNY